MSTRSPARRFDVFEKAPERRRRSPWSRVRRRPVLLAALALAAAGALLAFVYLGLRVTHSLPAQRRAERTLAAARRVVAAPEFESAVVAPFERFLGMNLPIARNTGPFADFVARSVAGELALTSVLPPPRPTRSEAVENWRAVMAALQDHDVRIYGLPSALMRGDAALREFIARRLRQADPTLAGVDPDSTAVDVAVTALLRQLNVSAPELNGIMFVAERAQRLRAPAGK